ncbi:MAG: hypothetical protein WCJ77_01025 [Opitutae bacterium]
MSENKNPPPTSRIGLFLFIIIFIGTAAWGGYVLAKNAHLKGAKSSVDPLEDRSLFGR